LYDLPSDQEIEAMVHAFHTHSENNNNIVLEEHQNTTIDEVLKIVRQRCDVIGNYLMYAIGSQRLFEIRKNYVSTSENARLALQSIHKCLIYNIPSNVEYFFSPVLREGVFVPNIRREYSLQAKKYFKKEKIEFDEENRNFSKRIFRWEFVSKNAKENIVSVIGNDDEELYKNLHNLNGF
jgi:hypothetical protein